MAYSLAIIVEIFLDIQNIYMFKESTDELREY